MTGSDGPSAAADVVVAGAGHNSLITAAYLTLAGRRCRVLDARATPGGGVASEELLLPGFRLDSCSTGHTLIQTNPLLVNDELGLIAEHGLTYLAPDPVAHVVFPDGESLTMWLDLDRTGEEIARFSRADEQAYRRLLAEYDAVKDIFNRQRFTPLGLGPSLDELLRGRDGEARWRRRAAMSAWAVIRHEFESRHVRAFMLWMAFQTGQPVDSAGSGPLAYSIIFGRQRRSWTIPRGGSGELARALVEVIERGGGEVICDSRVVELIISDGRCTGVATEDGARHVAREAVLSTIHVKDLIQMAPAEMWGDDFRYGIDTYEPGVSAFAAHYATTEPPRYPTRDGQLLEVVSAGVTGWPDDVVRMGRDVCEGRWPIPAARRPGITRSRFSACSPTIRAAVPANGSICGRGSPPSTWPICAERHPTSSTRRSWPSSSCLRWTWSAQIPTCGTAPSTVVTARWPTAAPCVPPRAGPSTGCQSQGSTRPGAPRTRVARSPGGRGATPPSSCCLTWATIWTRSSRAPAAAGPQWSEPQSGV
jgi:phytoene dehydrogenase-like protein